MIEILTRLSSVVMAAAASAASAAAESSEASEGQLWGRAAFVAVFLLLLAGLALIPGRLIGQAGGAPPWWRNVRVWAIAITLAQIVIYICLG